MTGLRRVPPGRAGQLWLRRRLAAARRGAELLEQKLRILRDREAELVARTTTTGAAWTTACREAETWLLRGALVSGEEAVRGAAAAGTAEATVTWTATMGVRYPSGTGLRLPEPGEREPAAAGAALHLAVLAYRRATAAAVQHAASQHALRTVRAETARTRRQLRGVQDRWVPRLETALAEARLAVDDLEHDEAVRRRWAAQQRAGPPGRPARPA